MRNHPTLFMMPTWQSLIMWSSVFLTDNMQIYRSFKGNNYTRFLDFCRWSNIDFTLVDSKETETHRTGVFRIENGLISSAIKILNCMGHLHIMTSKTTNHAYYFMTITDKKKYKTKDLIPLTSYT